MRQIIQVWAALLTLAFLCGAAGAIDVTYEAGDTKADPINVNQASTFTINSPASNPAIQSGNISGVEELTVQAGSGVTDPFLQLSGNNHGYTGQVFFRSGTLELTADQAMFGQMRDFSFYGSELNPTTLQIAANTAVTIDGVNSHNQRIKIESTFHGNFNLLDNATLTFADNNNGSEGAAIYIYRSAGNNSNLTMTAAASARYHFINNLSQSALGGGAIFNGGATVNITNATFTKNTVTDGNGRGGAIGNNGGTVKLSNVEFSENAATGEWGQGGAISSYGLNSNFTITDGQFTKNIAVTNGGAIFQGIGTLNLNVSAGQTSLFTGNLANSQPNSIAFAPVAFNTTTFKVNTANNATLDMLDPMSGTGYSGATINITKTGTGTWKLGGTSDTVASEFKLDAGALFLYRDGAVANANNNDATAKVASGSINVANSFTLAGTASLQAGGGNLITAHAITLSDNGTLGFDLEYHDGNLATPMLTLTASNVTLSQNNSIVVDLLSLGSQVAGSEYALAKFGNTGSFQNSYSANVLYQGQSTVGTRYDGAFTLNTKPGDNHKTLYLTQDVYFKNFISTWTGTVNSAWDYRTANWDNQEPSHAHQFADGDLANFAGTEASNRDPIAIPAGATLSLSGLYLSGHKDYNFAGGTLVAAAGRGSFDPLLDTAANGKLVLGQKAVYDANGRAVTQAAPYRGSADFTGLTSTSFPGGIDVHSGQLILGLTFGTGPVTVGSAGSIRFTELSTVDSLDASGKINLDRLLTVDGDVKLDNAKLSLDTGNAAAIHVAALPAGNVTLSGTTQVDLRNADASFSDYAFITAETIAGFNANRFTTLLDGKPLNHRQTAAYSFDDGSAHPPGLQSVLVSLAVANAELVWSGAAGPLWDVNNTKSWNLASAGTPDLFLNGDAVTFNSLGPGDVAVTPGGVKVAAMSVTDGSYNFSGGRIASTAAGSLAPNSEKLTLAGAGASAFFRNAGLDFAGGLTAAPGTRLGFGSGTNFTSAAGGAEFADGSGVVFEITRDPAGTSPQAGRVMAKDITIGNAALAARSDLATIVAASPFTATVMRAGDRLSFTPSEQTRADLPFYSYAFLPDGRDLNLNLTPKPDATVTGFADGANTLALAAALDAAFASGAILDTGGALRQALDSLFNSLTPGEVASRLRELSPAALAGSAALAPESANNFLDSLASLLRQENLNLDASGGTGDDSIQYGSSAASSSASPSLVLHCLPERRWHFRAVGLGEWSAAAGQGVDPGYSAKQWGGMLAGFRRQGDLVFGAALGASRAKLNWDYGLGRSDGDSFAGAIFASFNRGSFFIGADAILGTSKVESLRNLPAQNLTARADYRSHWYGADLYAGYRASLCDWDIVPALGLRALRFDNPAVTEQGAGNAGLAMAAQSWTGVEFLARVEVGKTIRIANSSALRPRAYAGAVLDAADTGIATTFSFVGAPGLPAFGGYSPESGRVGAQFGAGLDLILNDRVTLHAEYQGEIRRGYQRHSGRVGVGISF